MPASLNYYRQFDRFDPVRGDVSDWPFEYLPGIAARARALVRGRTRDQLIWAAQTLDIVVDDLLREMRADRRDDDDYEEGEEDVVVTVHMLKDAFGAYSWPPDEELPNARDHEYFAALALWLISDTIHWLKGTPPDPDMPPFDPGVMPGLLPPKGSKEAAEINQRIAGEYAAEAIEALCWAEHLVSLERLHDARATEIENEMRRRRSADSKSAALKKNRENIEMKQQVLARFDVLYPQGTRVNMAQAARDIHAENLVPVEYDTVLVWIRAYCKRTRPK